MQSLPPPSSSPDTRLGLAMVIIAWIIGLSLLGLFFHEAWQQKRGAVEPKTTVINGIKQTILDRNAYNQYVTKGLINDHEVLFLLDTGATDVVVPAHIAKKLNLKAGLRAKAQTAGGEIFIHYTVIAKLQIGNIVLHNLPASINSHMEDDEILLGMRALKHLTILQKGNHLILMPHQADITE